MIVKMDYCHVKKVAELEKMCFSSPWSENALSEEVENEGAYFIVSVNEVNEVEGYAGMHIVLDECYIDNIAVFPEARGRGTAKMLLTSLEEKVKEINAYFLTLEVREGNERARFIYEKFGFLNQGVRKNFYENPKENAVIYTKFYKES